MVLYIDADACPVKEEAERVAREKLNEEDGLTVSTDVQGVPLDIRVGRDGIDVNPGERERERESSGRR